MGLGTSRLFKATTSFLWPCYNTAAITEQSGLTAAQFAFYCSHFGCTNVSQLIYMLVHTYIHFRPEMGLFVCSFDCCKL